MRLHILNTRSAHALFQNLTFQEFLMNSDTAISGKSSVLSKKSWIRLRKRSLNTSCGGASLETSLPPNLRTRLTF